MEPQELPRNFINDWLRQKEDDSNFDPSIIRLIEENLFGLELGGLHEEDLLSGLINLAKEEDNHG